MTDKIDITIRTKEYEQKMENLNAQIKNLNTEIANLKSRAHDRGLGLYHNEETVARYTQKKQKEIDELNTQLQKLEQKYAEEQTILISGKISEIKDKIELLKKYQETAKKNPSLVEEYSEELFFKKSAEMQKEVAKKEAFLKNLEKQRDDERKKNADIEQRLKEERKAIFAKRKQGFSEPASQGYKGYTFEKLSDQELNQIQEAVKAGTIKGLEDLKRMIPTGKTVPLEYMKLFEGKKPGGERAHDYQETGKTAELYKDIFKGIKTISITEGGKTLFGDDYATKEQLIAYKQEADQKIKEIEDKRDKADQKQRIILNDELDELRKKANSLQSQIKNYDEKYPAKRGTVFHSFAEMMALGKLSKLKEALYSGDTKLSKILIDKYFKKGITAETLIGDSTTGFTKEDTEILNEFLDKIKDFTDVGGTSYGFFQGLNNYVNFLKENNITLTDAVEKSIGFVTNINGELVKFVGTIDAIFGNLLLDLKTGKMHPSAIAWQVNMGNFMRQMITGESAQKLGAFNPGMGKDFIPGFIPVDLIPREIMSQLIFEAGTGKKTDIDLTKYVKGGVFTDVTTDEETGETYPITYINQRKLPKRDYGASPKLKSEIDTLERESNELVESIKTLKGDELEHVLNQIYSTTDYSKGGIEGNKFDRQGYFWDLVRKKLPYDISTVLNYAMSEDGAAPKSKGVGTKTYRIEQGEGEPLAEIDVPTVLGISLKQWAKLANILSELPDGAKKVEKLVALFEREFESFSPDEQKRVVSSFNTLMTSESNFNPEYIRLKNQRELLRAKLQRPEQFENVNVDETQTALTAIDEQIAELERGNGLNFYQKFETFWNDVASEASKQLRETITESMSGFRSVKEFTEDKEQRQREYNPDVFDLETDEDGYRYVSRSGDQKDPIKMATITANRIGRIIDYSTRLEKAIEPMAKEMGVPVSDLAKTLLTDFAEKTGDRDAFNRYIRSKEFASDFKTAFPNFKGQITSEVEKWLVERLDPTIKEESEVLAGIEASQTAGTTTRYKLDENGNLVDGKVTDPHDLLKSVLGRRLSGTLYSNKEIIALEVIDDLLKEKNLGITERKDGLNQEATEKEEEWAKEFLNYDELMPEAQQVLEEYLQAEKALQDAQKTMFELQNELELYGGIEPPTRKTTESDWDFKYRKLDWEETKTKYDSAKGKFEDFKAQMIEARDKAQKTFKSGKVAGYSSEKMSDFLKKRAEEGIEKKRQENIAYAAAYSYKFSGKDKKELTEDDINEYLKFYSEQFEMSTEELLKEYNKENVYMGFYDFLQKKAKEKNITLRRFSPAKTKTAVEKGIGEGVADKITETIGDATDKINGQTIEQAVSEVVSDAVDIGGVDEKAVNEAVVEKTQAKVKAKSQKTRKPRKKSTAHVTTDDTAIGNEIPISAVAQSQQDNSAILNELQGIHKDTQSIDSKMDYVLPSKDSGTSNKMEVSSDGGTGGGDGGGKKPPKSGGRKGKSNEKKAQEQAVKEALKTEREYQQYLNQRFSLLSKIEAAQAKYNISIGKERAAAAGVIQTGNIELKYLDKRNEALIESMAHNQSARKAQMDYQQELKVATMQQQKLLGTKGAKSLWDVMANDIQRAAVRITDFGIAARALNKIPQDIQKIIQYTKELDAAMANIRIVGGYTEEQAKRLMRSYSELGNQLSATTTEIAQGMNDWLRQGYDAEEQLEALVTASTKLSKLGMISASEATTALTSALKAFNLAAEDAIKVVDKLTKVDQLAAVSAGGISTALQKSATSAKLAGMSMDELIGSVSVIGEVTQQSMDTVGNAMKSILARYGNVKAGVFTQMGLNDDGETSENINDIEKVLSKLGIKVRSSAKEMRSITDVLDDVNSKWSTFDTVTKNAIATAFGGTRMRENFLVLMENWNRVKELTEESANAAGTADEKYGAYTDSIEAGLKRVQNAWENMSQKFESSWLIKSGIGFMEQFVSHLDTITRLLTIFAATKFADKIFTFGANTVKGVPNILKKLTGLGTNSAGSVTYDEKGNMVVSPQETQRDFLIRKGTQTIVDTLNKNGVDTNAILNQIKAIIETTSLGAKAQYDPNTGKIISGLNVGGKDATYVGINASGERVFTYTKTGRKITSKKRLDDLNRQQDLIDEYNKNLGTPANPNQISGYTGQTWWKGVAKNVKIGDKTYTRTKVPKEVYGSRYAYIDEYGNDIRDISPEQADEIDKLNKKLKQQKRNARIKAGVTAGGVSALTALTTSKQAGSGWGKAITNSDVTVEENSVDKAFRAGMSGILTGAGAALLGPFGAMLGQTLGEGFAEMFSAWFHRDEIEMKQRVMDAKANLSALESLGSKLDSIDLNEKNSGENFADEIRNYFFENPDLKETFIEALNSNNIVSGVKTLSDLTNVIKNNNISDNKKIFQALKETQLKEEIKNLYDSQEEEWSEINSLLTSDLSAFGISGNTLEQRRDSAENAINNLKEFLSNPSNNIEDRGYFETLLSSIETYLDKFNTAIDKQQSQTNDILAKMAQYGFVKSGISDLSGYDLTDLGMEGAIKKVAQTLQESGYNVIDSEGKINADIYEQILSQIQKSEIYKSLQYGTKTIGELDLTSEKDVKRLKQFARAFNITYDEALKLREEFGDLSTQMAYMTPQEVVDYYNNLSSIFNDLAVNSAVSSDNITKILTDSNYQSLIPYLTQGTEALQSKLYERLLGGEQDLVYSKSLFSSLMSNSTIFEEFKNKLDNADLQRKISDLGYTSFQSIITAVQEGTLNEDDEIVKRAKAAIASWNVEYKKDLEGTNKLISYQTNLLDDQITNLNQQKEALSQINDEREKELNLIKAKDALENAKKIRKRVYRAGVGFTYESDETAIEEAQKKVEDLNIQKQQNILQFQIDALQQQKDILDNLPKAEEMEQLSKIYSQWAGSGEGSMKSVSDATAKLVDKYRDATVKLDTYTEFLKSLQPSPQPPEDDGKGGDETIITIPGKKIDANVAGVGRGFFDWGSDDVWITYDNIKYQVETSAPENDNQAEITNSFINTMEATPDNGEFYAYKGKYYVYHSKAKKWESILPGRLDGDKLIKILSKEGYSNGTLSVPEGLSLINELGTEAVITPGGTLTALPSKTGIVPADITRNVWALGEVAPTLVAQLGSLTQKTLSGNVGNTTYEEGQYFDNFTMNVYPAKGDDLSKILEQARAQMRLTRHNN